MPNLYLKKGVKTYKDREKQEFIGLKSILRFSIKVLLRRCR
jgi:hypothetical protein